MSKGTGKGNKGSRKRSRASGAKRISLSVCHGTCCVLGGARDVADALKAALREQLPGSGVRVKKGRCSARCGCGPVVTVEPDGTVYAGVTPADAAEIVKKHVIGGKVVRRLAAKARTEPGPVPALAESGFFKDQVLIAMRNRGRINPDSIDDYIANEGYLGMAKAVTEMKPERIIAEVKKAGLRGRGGGGFPTGLKWEICRNSPSPDDKYIICNADEGDPGAFMDRSLLESDPHSVVEGMIIGARAIGATRGYVYVREEYPLACDRVIKAIDDARAYGLLGDEILGSDFSFDIDVVRGAGAFVCGEETALMASIEGREGKPRPRPPFPAQSGLWGKPTNVNNVETWANVPPIALRGGAWYASLGTARSKGTKVFSLVGKVKNTGLIEVPMGTTHHEADHLRYRGWSA